VRLPQDSKLNSRLQEIYYLITINENYPQKPPFLQCLTDVNIIYFIFSLIILLYMIVVISKMLLFQIGVLKIMFVN
jgi:hypothetical protein